jgi:hypothetical protein
MTSILRSARLNSTTFGRERFEPSARRPKTDSWFARAVAFLDAEEVSPGRYAYRDGATRRYFVVTGGQLDRLGRYLEAEIYHRARPWETVQGAGGYAEWGVDVAAFIMPDWWTPDMGLDRLAVHPWRNARRAEREKIEKFMRWIAAHPDVPTTALVERLKLPRNFHHCVMIDTIRFGSEASARDAASTVAREIPDTFAFDESDGPYLSAI